MKNGKPQLKDIPIPSILFQQHRWWISNPKPPWTYEAFPQWPEKLVLRKMEELVSDGYLEYGVSLRTAWLTDKGMDVIRDLEVLGDDNQRKAD